MRNTKIEYFKDYWRDLTHECHSIEKEFVHLILYNPRELFKEFAKEIEIKKLSNNDNKKFFQDKINEFEKLDLNALDFIRPTIKLIKQQFSKKDDYGYFLHLLKMATRELENFYLGKEAVKELSETLSNNKKIEADKIKHLANIIIFELIYKKYSLKTIAKIIDDIFSTYQILPDETLYFKFPHKFTCSNMDSKSNEFIDYQNNVKNYIENLTDKERIQAISNYFDKEPEKLRFVFQIKGLRGDFADIKIRNVQIYNPKHIRLFNKSTEFFSELFDKDEIKDDIYYCNGAVEMDVIDRDFAKQEALQMLENTLDLIASKFISYEQAILINPMKYYVIDKDGNDKGSGTKNNWAYLPYQSSLNLNNADYKEYIFSESLSENLLEVDKNILDSMHWKRKAIQSNENNEKILWHWVALENIFTKYPKNTTRTIFEVVPKILAKKYMFNFAWKHYHKLEEMASKDANLSHYKKRINLSKELMDSVGLNTLDGRVRLENFISNIEAIKSNLDTEDLFYEQLDFLNSVFNNPDKCLKLMGKFEEIFFEKLLFIYRIRNQIVHNAHSKSTPMINYYVDFIETVSWVCINEFIEKRNKFSFLSAEEIINNIIYCYDKMKVELKNNNRGTSILLD